MRLVSFAETLALCSRSTVYTTSGIPEVCGINFEIMSVLKGAAEAIGLVRSDDPDKGPVDDLSWGLCHRYDSSWQWHYTRRFESFYPRHV